MANEVTCWCRYCKEELSPDHTGPCPKCGKTGKHHDLSLSDVFKIEDSLSRTHKPRWSSESLSLLSGFVAIFLAVVCPGIILLLPFILWINYAILVGFLLVMGVLLWWQRYNILSKIRVLESKFGGEKKF